MSESQIKQILDKLEKQNKLYEKTVTEHKKAVRELQQTIDAMVMELGTLKNTLAPINEVFVNASGFGRITLATMKFVGFAGVALGAIYAAISWLRHP